MSDALRITAQVAVEAIINEREGYEQSTIDAVIAVATEAGVADFYLDMLK